MEKLILVKPNDVMRLLDFDSNSDDNLDFYYKHIECDLIDIVQPYAVREELDKCNDLILIVDDEGAIKNNPKLNVFASLVCGQPIYGNVLVAKEQARDDGLYTVGLNMQDVKEFENALSRLIRMFKPGY